jgi:hypothetical protein
MYLYLSLLKYSVSEKLCTSFKYFDKKISELEEYSFPHMK